MKYLNEAEIRSIINQVDPRIGVLKLQCEKKRTFIEFMQNDILFEEDIKEILKRYCAEFKKKNPRTERKVVGKIDKLTLKIEIN